MNCPYCEYRGHRMDLHAHLIKEHAEGIKIYVDEALGKMVFEMSCPVCNESVKQTLKKSAAILAEYEQEIRMVAFDLLLYHLQEKHDDLVQITKHDKS